MRVVDLFSGAGGLGLGFTNAGHKIIASYDNWKAAIAVHRANFKHPIYELDLAGIDHAAEEIRRHGPEMIIGGPPCFPSGTQVLCRSGFKDISEVNVGDQVLTHNNRWRRVTSTMSRYAETIVVKGHGHPCLSTTEDHQFYVTSYRLVSHKRKYHREFSSPFWCPASEMPKKFWASPIKFPKSKVPKIRVGKYQRNPCKITKEFMWFVGAWLGDGWLRTGQRCGCAEGQGHGTVLICCNKNQTEELAARITAAGLKFNVSSERTTDRFCIYSKPLTNWLRHHFGRYSHGKKIPVWSLGMSKSYREALLNGYIWADGWWNDGKPGITSINKDLLMGIKLIAQTLGYTVVCSYAEPREHVIIEGRHCSERRQWNLKMCKTSPSPVRIGDHVFCMVKKIIEKKQVEKVFDIEVEDDHSFIADGIVVHNCQSYSHAGKRDADNDARSNLTLAFARIVTAIRPRFFVMENVDRFAKLKQCEVTRFLFEEAGYGVHVQVLDAAFCGAPQHRKRCFMVGALNQRDFSLEAVYQKNLATEPLTVRNYFGDKIDTDFYYRHPRTYERRAVFSIDEPSPTIRGCNRPVPKNYKFHPGDACNDPTKIRPLTTKERSMIQTFPECFSFEGISKSDAEQVIGNAVPVKQAEFVARCLGELTCGQ